MTEQPHILLIDDDPDMHDVVRLILEPVGYRVSCCSTARDGLETLRRDPPELLLLDVMLGTPTEGLELAERIRANGGLHRPIILISSAALDSELEGQGGAGRLPAELFLEKPLDAPGLRAAVARLLAAPQTES